MMTTGVSADTKSLIVRSKSQYPALRRDNRAPLRLLSTTSLSGAFLLTLEPIR